MLFREIGEDLLSLWNDHSDWSQRTFGSDSVRGPLGPLKHLEKEAREAQANPRDLSEYADCLLLLMDSARRAGIGPWALIQAAHDKLQINKTRTWPHSRGDDPVEHVRED